MTLHGFFSISNHHHQNPFLLLRLPSEACANKIMARTMLGRFMIEVWGLGNSWAELHASLARYPADQMAPYSGKEDRFIWKAAIFGLDSSLRWEEFFPDPFFRVYFNL